MPTILAIDAAWTPSQPSGVAVVTRKNSGWQCVAVAPSYDDFIKMASGHVIDWTTCSIRGTLPGIPHLIQAAQQIAGSLIDVVAVDLPVATIAFSTRRAADNAISREFGGRWCSAHTPSATRPGELGLQVSRALHQAGFPTATTAVTPPCLIEVYPHPALLSLLHRELRVPYKVAKANKYWPGKSIRERIENLLREFRNIYTALTLKFGNLRFALPAPGDVHRLSQLKRYEDVLDALVCAWVGVEYMEGRTVPLGNNTAAIWCPSDVVINHRNISDSHS